MPFAFPFDVFSFARVGATLLTVPEVPRDGLLPSYLATLVDVCLGQAVKPAHLGVYPHDFLQDWNGASEWTPGVVFIETTSHDSRGEDWQSGVGYHPSSSR